MPDDSIPTVRASRPISPVARFTMQMRHGDNDNGRFVLSVNQSVGEADQKALTQIGFDLRTGHRERHCPSDCLINRIEKCPSQPRCLRVIPVNSAVEFLLSQGEEPDSHRERCLAITLA